MWVRAPVKTKARTEVKAEILMEMERTMFVMEGDQRACCLASHELVDMPQSTDRGKPRPGNTADRREQASTASFVVLATTSLAIALAFPHSPEARDRMGFDRSS